MLGSIVLSNLTIRKQERGSGGILLKLKCYQSVILNTSNFISNMLPSVTIFAKVSLGNGTVKAHALNSVVVHRRLPQKVVWFPLGYDRVKINKQLVVSGLLEGRTFSCLMMKDTNYRSF